MEVIDALDSTDSSAVAAVKSLPSERLLEDILFIDSNFKIVSKSIILLESSKLQLSDALNIVDKVSQTEGIGAPGFLESRLQMRPGPARDEIGWPFCHPSRLTVGLEIFTIFYNDCLASHLYRIGISASPICVLCNDPAEMNEDHLKTCEALRSEETTVQKYWKARLLMASLPDARH
ncbi:hypothetical protein ANN_00170 [Periplaneta americana]|uniref:Uncharacterized protein n=1 Tax=Periplaneta americana TaxID=6978 RepID=A0ABQ8TQ39_PERAM|nr:hypothetical protein ANN_00170 [Periplaneta americana]